MLADVLSTQEGFLQCLQEVYQKQLSDSFLGQARAQAWSRFLDLGLPERSDEPFRYLPLHKLYARKFLSPETVNVTKESIAEALLPECKESALVFVDGVYRSDLSRKQALPASLVVTPLSEAANSYGSFLQNRWTALQKEEDPFALLNMAAHGEGAFIYLPPNQRCEVPVQLLHFVSQEGCFTQPRQQIVVGSGAELTLIATAKGPAGWTNHAIDISQAENSRVSLVQSTPDLDPQTWYTDSLRVVLKRDAFFNHCALTTGAETHRSSYGVVLAGSGASGNLAALTAALGRRQSHAHILMEHQAPHTDSRQLFKTVLTDEARSSFEGKILVQQAAQKTDAFQLNNNIILGPKAHADSKPNLEIFADDVKASHGATFGQPDTESLFYMKSRGIEETEARQILLLAYADELIAELPLASLREKATTMIRHLG